MSHNEATWGTHDGKPPCHHLLALRNALASLQMAVWSAYEQPSGLVSVSCEHCKRTYEVALHNGFGPLSIRHS